MGNTTPSSQITSQIINKHWQPITPLLWKNKATSQIIQQKKLVFQSQSQMKYVFACLLRRMNTYHPNVLKVFYLRKYFQKGSVCNCGEKHTIQVYLENVESTLEKFISNKCKSQQQQKNKFDYPHRKCICMQIVKAALYLKQRYGPFTISKDNIWIQQPHIEHQLEDRQLSQSFQINQSQEPSLLRNIKAKVWISQLEQQNFPDNSCQEKQMCLSIVELIRNDLIRNKLCACYPNMQTFQRYFYLNTIKDLEQNIRKQYESNSKTQLIISNVAKVPFARTLRSYSSQNSSYQPHPHFALNFQYPPNRGYQFNQQPPSQRKYSSIQYVKKPLEKQHLNMTVGRKTQIMKNTNNAFQDHTKQNNNFSSINKIDVILQEVVPTVVRPWNKFQKTKTNKLNEKTSDQHSTLNYQQIRAVKAINSKVYYQHGNNFVNSPVINIADMSRNQIQISKNKFQTISKTQRHKQGTKIEEKISVSNQNIRENIRNRSISQQGGQFSNIELNCENKIKHIEISQDKGTNPTDRTKFDLSLKEDQKKQQQAINSSRKNISIIPISLESTSGAGSILKPIIHSYDHLHKIQPQSRDFQQEILQKKQQSINESKQKKQSASSSKSQKNYVSYQSANSNEGRHQQKRPMNKKRMSDSIVPSKKESESNSSKQQQNIKQQCKKQKQRSLSIVNRLQDLGHAIGNEEMGRLRKSEYIMSGQNSSKSSRMKQKNIIQDKTIELNNFNKNQELKSLALMQFKFQTNKKIHEDNHHVENHYKPNEQHKSINNFINQSVSIKQCTSGQLKECYATQIKTYHQLTQQNLTERLKSMSSDKLEKLKQTPQSSRRQSLTKEQINQSPKSSSVQKSLNSIQFQPHTFSKIDSPYKAQQVKVNLTDMSSLIKRQIEQPSFSYENNYRSQQPLEYQININHQQTYFYQDSQQSLERQKQMSHPILTEINMAKKLSLKQEFNQLLNFDDSQEDFSPRIKTYTQENKYKRLKLDQKQGVETVSIYNESDYNQSEDISKRTSHKQYSIKQANPPINRKKQQTTVPRYTQQNKTKKPISKKQIDQEMMKKKMQQIMINNGDFTQATPQQMLRLTSSGHEDNSIKQKVISKKAQFAELKNQMNNLLL